VVSVPIINHPQAAILSAEAIVKRPVVVDDAIAVRSVMNLEVSFDHRILDGGVALRFLKAAKRRLEGYGPESEID
jgi:2-oxoisovalerate dehydrogenase E2 component (dihydrolipoyl transacylase)